MQSQSKDFWSAALVSVFMQQTHYIDANACDLLIPFLGLVRTLPF